MKRYDYILKIDNPCSQNLTLMVANDIGKYCSHCSKNVINFIGHTDNELLQIIENSTGKLWGQFDKSQLDRLLIYSGRQTINPQLYKIIAGLLLVSTANNLVATTQISETNIFSQLNNSFVSKTANDIQNVTEPDSLKKVIQGVIIDRNKETLIGSLITIKGTDIKTVADIDGGFLLKIPDGYLPDSISLEVSCIGYQTLVFYVKVSELPFKKDIILLLSDKIKLATDSVVVGNLSIHKSSKNKRKWWQRRREAVSNRPL